MVSHGKGACRYSWCSSSLARLEARLLERPEFELPEPLMIVFTQGPVARPLFMALLTTFIVHNAHKKKQRIYMEQPLIVWCMSLALRCVDMNTEIRFPIAIPLCALIHIPAVPSYMDTHSSSKSSSPCPAEYCPHWTRLPPPNAVTGIPSSSETVLKVV